MPTDIKSNQISNPKRNQFPPNMTMMGWMRWQENQWKMYDRQVAWIREQKAYSKQGNENLIYGN